MALTASNTAVCVIAATRAATSGFYRSNVFTRISFQSNNISSRDDRVREQQAKQNDGRCLSQHDRFLRATLDGWTDERADPALGRTACQSEQPRFPPDRPPWRAKAADGRRVRVVDLSAAEHVVEDRSRDLVALDDALRELAEHDPRKAMIVELREREPHERAAFLRTACGEDEALRREVESLLTHNAGAGGFLEHPAFVLQGLTPRSDRSQLPVDSEFRALPDCRFARYRRDGRRLSCEGHAAPA
jgi:hypothetical protein